MLLESVTELKPSAESNHSPFEFKDTHIGYGETWKKKSIVEAYLMKSSYPNYTILCGNFKGFTSLNLS